jgi:hypothetical protein
MKAWTNTAGNPPSRKRTANLSPLEELFLIGRERRFKRFLHCDDSTTKRSAVK